MNTIFVKEVTSSVMKKNIVKLDLTYINDDNYILELNINSKKLADIASYLHGKESSDVISNNSGFVNRLDELRKQFVVKRFNSDIKNIVKKNELVGYSVIFSNEIKRKKVKKYIEQILNNFSINEYLCLNSMEQNYIKYIEEYILNNNLKKENINIVLMAQTSENINFDIIDTLNCEYKDLSIFCAERIGKGFQNKIKKINDEFGSCIQILNRNSRDFRKYNVCVFLDKSRSEYCKYKFNKKNCYIDFMNKENDKFNKKYIKLEEGIKNNKYYSNKIKELYQLYGKITVSNTIID